MSTGLFSPSANPETEASKSAPTAKPVSELAAARHRASGGYTDTLPSPQAANDRNTNYLNEQESQTERRPARIHTSARAPHIEGATHAGKILRQALRTRPRMRARQVATHADAFFFHILIAAGCIAAWRAA